MKRPVRVVPLAACAALVALAGVSLPAADFIRGDVNGDGRVTISDAYRFRMAVFDGRALECLDAADVNDDERLDERDWGHIISHLDGSWVPAMRPPFPAPGPDLTAEPDLTLDCQAHGGGEALEDPAAEIRVLPATAPGGGDDRAFIRIAYANSVPIAAHSGQIHFPEPIVREIAGWSTGRSTARAFRSSHDRFWFARTDYQQLESIPPGNDTTAVEVLVYLKEGVPAGEYPIVLEAGELTDTETGRAIVPRLIDGTLVVGETVTSVPPGTADFIRGDVNGDGRVTISDIYRFEMWSSRNYFPPRCLDAADVNDSGSFDPGDIIHLVRAVYLGGPPIPSPFPSPGQDSTDDLDLTMDCKAYGGGEVIEAPDIELKLLDTRAFGGNASDLVIRIALTSSVPIGAISGQVRFLDPILWGLNGPGGCRDGCYSTWGYFFSKMTGEDRYHFGAVPHDSLPPGQEVIVEEQRVCLADGVPAGEYAMLLESVELTDAATGKTILPRATGGTMIVEEAITGDQYECRSFGLPPGPRPGDVSASFSLGGASAPPGGSFTVPFTVSASEPIQGYSFSIDFDEEVLQVLSAEYVWEVPAGTSYWVQAVEFNNQNDRPGNAGVDEGFVGGIIALDISPPNLVTMPAGVQHRVVEIRFQVKPDAAETTTLVRFQDGAGPLTKWDSVFNVVTTHGFSVTPEIANSFTFLNGRVSVVADVATFVRGDANGDETLDIGDAVNTLNFLFLAGARPACYDAADANDDARLDIVDPIATLGFLFRGAATLPPPYPQAGEDPTPDSMGCLFR